MRFVHDFYRTLGHQNDETDDDGQILVAKGWPRCITISEECDPCKQMKKLSVHHKNLTRPITSMFEVFSVDLSGPFPETKMGHKYLLVFVENLKGWPIVVPKRYAIVDVVQNFIPRRS